MAVQYATAHVVDDLIRYQPSRPSTVKPVVVYHKRCICGQLLEGDVNCDRHKGREGVARARGRVWVEGEEQSRKTVK